MSICLMDSFKLVKHRHSIGLVTDKEYIEYLEKEVENNSLKASALDKIESAADNLICVINNAREGN